MTIPSAEQIHDWLLKEENCDSDDHRFYCSYLISLTSLTIANANDEQQFFATMKDSLFNALQIDKLSDNDKLAIKHLWNQACQTQLHTN